MQEGSQAPKSTAFQSSKTVWLGITTLLLAVLSAPEVIGLIPVTWR